MSRASIPPLDCASLRAQLGALSGLVRLRDLSAGFAEASDETIAAILDSAAAFAADRLEALNAQSDSLAPQLVDGAVVTSDLHREVWRDYAEGGWIALDLPEPLGGQGLPLVVAVAVQEVFDRHCAAFGMLPVPMRSAVRLIEAWTTDAEIRSQWLPKLIAGEWGATICISEVGAGSDASRIRTKAVPRGDGRWSITGEKQWISFGGHDLTGRIVHCLLARAEGAAGPSKGLSLFLVPDRIDDAANGVVVRKLEHKLGLHLSPTCAMGFEDATGYLLGEEGRGLAQMFVMITNMRMAVGAMGLGIASAAADVALGYARQRLQGGAGPQPLPIIEHADVQRMLLAMQADVECARALIYAAAVEADLARVETDDAARRDSAALAQWLLPIVKTLGGELAFTTADGAIQVLGGAGYTTDWPVEQLLRDSRVLPIFEGTTGMQGLDLLHRRLWKDGGAGLRVFLARARADVAVLEGRDAAAATGIIELLETTADQLGAMRDRPRDGEAGATGFLHLAIDTALAWSAARLAALRDDTPASARLRALGGFQLGELTGRARHHATQALRGAAALDGMATLL
ncbi:acyl-CoA dehydrogenase family protein [Bradyrhizobium sp. STM 3809]|uniref:acyl-CoA dehydrogenase family protein n=1 Tax=Bradyrhizobium sp. STM 3809 TaxID=551936 RepID=UPI0002407CD0|nr:acyl-CoA dehydrogenase family protein [Bradyrhizobium sp. STM 3809]CCE02635.1 putative acyl-CoA dehydrogenase [Bradyrhizobium sp. STM 3809]